jgi:hypothetical protein
MNEAERRIAEHDNMIRDLVENDPLFQIFKAQASKCRNQAACELRRRGTDSNSACSESGRASSG